ncbi:MAG: lipid A 3-O-deacylase [Thiomicrorhabdus sp.]|nr:MAG: lipid A 3-O-deacylase [Thiomicrorhabdus sp.]
MHSSKRLLTTLSVTIFSINLLFSGQIQAKQENNDLMSFAILGAISSFGLACYQGKAPCTLEPGIDTDKLIYSLDIGADRSAKQTSIAIGADWKEPVFEADSWSVTGRLEGRLHQWYSTLSHANNKSGYMLGIAPVFNYQPRNYSISSTGLVPFAEMGGGPYLMDNITVEDEYKSTQFQFGSIFGFGVKNKDLELTYRYLHISNAGIEMPNPGTDFHSIHLGYRF